jgi:mRNA interferase MazF
MNTQLRRVTVVPLTSGSHPAPFRTTTNFANKPGLVLADQIRTLDRLRFKKQIGVIDPDTLTAALAVLREMFEE